MLAGVNEQLAWQVKSTPHCFVVVRADQLVFEASLRRSQTITSFTGQASWQDPSILPDEVAAMG